MRKIMSLLKVEDSSNILVLHFRGNNIPDNKDQQHLGHFGKVVPDTFFSLVTDTSQPALAHLGVVIISLLYRHYRS